MLLAALFTSLYQINRTKKNLDNVIHKTSRVMLAQNQLEHDLMGAFVPVTPPAKAEEPKEEQAKEGDKKEPKKEEKKEEKKEPEKPKPTVDKIFFSENKGANLQTLTFISNNPMPVYWSKKAGRPQPKLARMVYRLQPDPAHKNSYQLLRQEGDELAYEFFDPKIPVEKQEFRSYELLDGIKNLSVLYYYVPVKKQAAAKPGEKKEEEPKEQKIEYKTAKEWGQQKKEDQQKSDMPPLPRFAEFTLVLWDAAYQRDSTWKFTVPILPPSQLSAPKSPTPPPPSAKKPETTPSKTDKAQGQPASIDVPVSSGPPHQIAGAFPKNVGASGVVGIREGTHIGPRFRPSNGPPSGMFAGLEDKLPSSPFSMHTIKPN